ncbi:uncharacterized protein PAC_16793 [Phialocephala subalpina]|uniref:Uncharacterized protein n=1 Tax=Phialocephala subalpina TaxID=576137 RepID=A0A1L7XPE8_9HELO|nr:uncharacterized protein PAC_16793 [Phialocephala subalpina]
MTPLHFLKSPSSSRTMQNTQLGASFGQQGQVQSEFSQQWQSQTQSVSQSHYPTPGASTPLSRDQLVSLFPNHRAEYLTNILTQAQTITIKFEFDLSLTKLSPQLASSLHLTNPNYSDDTLTLEAAHVFFSKNLFLIKTSLIPTFVSWYIGGYKPSNLMSHLTILTGPQNNRQISNAAFWPLLSLPNLRTLKIIFRDRRGKPAGPYSWLRPATHAILLLQQRLGLGLKLWVGTPSGERSYEEEEWDFEADREEANMKEVTDYLRPATDEERREWEEWQGICERYRGPLSSKVTMLWQAGKEWVTHEMWDLMAAKVSVREWNEMGRLEILELGNVVMS